jgi:coenzyme F420-0:L-glutamate ligase/coenzyme F420-1:gamma-L-glutamate ligase
MTAVNAKQFEGDQMLALTPLVGLPIFQTGDVLGEILLETLEVNGIKLQDGDILVVAQKIVSKVEGRKVNLAEVEVSRRARELAKIAEKDPRLVELILRESRDVLRLRAGVIIVEHRLGFVCANAGIDHSNVAGESSQGEEWVLLLPEYPDGSARDLRDSIQRACGKSVGVLIIDSHGRAWRIGTVGVAIGVANVPAVVDLRGFPDLFGYRLRVTQLGAADELAAAASLVMGQANEGTPVVHVRGFPYALRESCLDELIRRREDDLFR